MNASQCIDPVFGPTVLSGYWSMTTYATALQRAWGARFDDGSVINDDKASSGYVRAVRGAL